MIVAIILSKDINGCLSSAHVPLSAKPINSEQLLADLPSEFFFWEERKCSILKLKIKPLFILKFYLFEIDLFYKSC